MRCGPFGTVVARQVIKSNTHYLPLRGLFEAISDIGPSFVHMYCLRKCASLFGTRHTNEYTSFVSVYM